MTLRTALVSLLAGVVAFSLGTVVVTEALDPYVWPSLLVGLPVGVGLGLSTVLVAYVSIGYLQERRDTGSVSAQTRRRLWTIIAAVVAAIVVGGATAGLLATQAVGVATALFAGIPVGTVAAVLAAAVVWYVGREESGGETENAERTSG